MRAKRHKEQKHVNAIKKNLKKETFHIKVLFSARAPGTRRTDDEYTPCSLANKIHTYQVEQQQHRYIYDQSYIFIYFIIMYFYNDVEW